MMRCSGAIAAQPGSTMFGLTTPSQFPTHCAAGTQPATLRTDTAWKCQVFLVAHNESGRCQGQLANALRATIRFSRGGQSDLRDLACTGPFYAAANSEGARTSKRTCQGTMLEVGFRSA